MPTHRVVVASPVLRSARVQQVESLFDIPPSERSSESWEIDVPLDERDWHVGLVVGPSGSGKTTLARALFGAALRIGYDDWPSDACILDAFPSGVSIKDIVASLGSIGFNSPPNWLRPFGVLSTGEQFRVTAARAILEAPDLVALDEFTSTVDRQVAQIASHSVQKAVRLSGKRLVAVTCHYDVLEWLQPDWVYEPHLDHFAWRLPQRHPALPFQVYRVDRACWRLFSRYHYLSADLNQSAQCFGAFLGDECVAFTSYLHSPHPRTRNIKRGHRLVVRPDFQGLGLGGRLDDWLGQWLFEQGFRYHNTVAHPAMIAYYSHSPRWRVVQELVRPQNIMSVTTKQSALKRQMTDLRRLSTMSFEYVPPARNESQEL